MSKRGKRFLAGLVLASLLTGVSGRAFADETTAVTSEETVEEGADETGEPSGEGLTPEGNLTLVDDIGTVESGKQFITLVSRNGNYFYLIIDRDKDGNENVHLLNLVDERDLLEIMEEAGEVLPETETVVSETEGFVNLFPETVSSGAEETEDGNAPEETEEKGTLTAGGKGKTALLVLLGGSVFVCILFLIRLIRKKKKEKAKKDPDEELFFVEEEDPEREEDEKDEDR